MGVVRDQGAEEGEGDGDTLQQPRADLAELVPICWLRVVAR